MENLKISNIIPSSISQISYANEESESATSYNLSQNKNQVYQTQRNDDYLIKINAPDHTQQVNEKFEKLQRFTLSQQQPASNEELPKQQEIEYKQKVTGYDINRDALNEEEITKAFKILDVNKDELITKEDLVFMLDYIKEDYSMDEVEEMISMLSSDKKQVTLEDFKKIGKAEIMPLAHFKIPTQKVKQKTAILQNIQKTELINISPGFVKQKIIDGTISFDKFEQAKNNPSKEEEVEEVYDAEVQFQRLITKLPLRQKRDFYRRKEQFSNIAMINMDIAQKNYKHIEDRQISQQEISSLLQINEKQTRTLYPNPTENSLFVIIEAIVYSCLKKMSKLEKCLFLLNHKSTVNFKELLHVLMLIKGKDETLEKKLIAILKGKRMSLEMEINKMEAIELIKQFISIL